MSKNRPRLGKIGVRLAVAVGAVAALLNVTGPAVAAPRWGPGQHVAALTDCAEPGPSDCYTTRVAGLINTGPGIELHQTYVDTSYRGASASTCLNPASPLLLEYAQNGSYSFCIERDILETGTPDTRFVAYYEIYLPADQSTSGSAQDTGYYVDLYSFVPLAGKNEVACTVRSRNGVNPPEGAPYVCTTAWGNPDPHSIDPQPHWTISEKPTKVIDAATASQAELNAATNEINESCANGQPECSYTATSQRVYAPEKSHWIPLTDGEVNCDTKDGKTYEYDRGWTYSWSNSLGGKITFKGGIDKIIEASIEGNYTHTWAETQSSTEKHTQTIPYHKVGFFYLQPGLLEINGTFQIVKPDRIDVIKNVTVNFPLSKEFTKEGFAPVQVGVVWPVQYDIDPKNCPASVDPPDGGPPPGATIGAPQPVSTASS